MTSKGINRKISRKGVNGKEQNREIAPLSPPQLYQYHVWKSRGPRLSLSPSADAHDDQRSCP